MKIILFGVWLTYGSDALSTNYALKHGGREVLIPSQNALVIDSVIGSEAALTTVGLKKFEINHPTASKILGVALVAMRGFIVYHNINQLRNR